MSFIASLRRLLKWVVAGKELYQLKALQNRINDLHVWCGYNSPLILDVTKWLVDMHDYPRQFQGPHGDICDFREYLRRTYPLGMKGPTGRWGHHIKTDEPTRLIDCPAPQQIEPTFLIAFVLQSVAEDLVACEPDEWNDVSDLLTTTLNNIKHDVGDALGDSSHFLRSN